MPEQTNRPAPAAARAAEHPVIVFTAFLCPLALGDISLKAGLLLSLLGGIALLLLPAAAFALRRVSPAARLALCLLLCGAALCAVAALLYPYAPGTLTAAALVWPLLAPDAARLMAARDDDPDLPDALRRGLRDAAGFIALAVPLGAVREVLGEGAIFGYALPLRRTVYSATLPAFALIIIGVLAAAAQARRLRRAEASVESSTQRPELPSPDVGMSLPGHEYDGAGAEQSGDPIPGAEISLLPAPPQAPDETGDGR